MFASSATLTQASAKPPVWRDKLASQRPGSFYGIGGRPVKLAAICFTALMHLAVGAVLALGWQRLERQDGEPHLVSVTVPLRPADEPRQRPTSGTKAPTHHAEPVPKVHNPPPTILLAPLAQIAAEALEEIPAPDEGGLEDALALTTQAYRRAIMDRLEDRRRRAGPQTLHGRQESGAIVFRIERSGRLLDASIAQSTGARKLDRAALAVVHDAAPFPAIPEALPDELTLTLPIEFLTAGHHPQVAAQ